MQYGGSRRKNQRFQYSSDSPAGFAELVPSYVPTAEEYFRALQQVPGVREVKWHTTKTSQGHKGNHYMERNLLVYSDFAGPGYNNIPIEFELTRHNHLHNSSVPYTVTACFKEPPPGSRTRSLEDSPHRHHGQGAVPAPCATVAGPKPGEVGHEGGARLCQRTLRCFWRDTAY